MISEVTNEDNLIMMGRYPDKFFDLAIVDPPYGIERFKKGSLRFDKKKKHIDGIKWDTKPDKSYFDELFRVSKYQIIWGANNFTLPESEYFLIWNKQQTVDNFASAEYAWTNYKMPAKVFTYSIHKHNQTNKIHETQKPVSLYEFILRLYTEPGFKILDTHLGSGSSRIAAYDLGFDFYGCELDKDYFDASCKRFNIHISQQKLFTPTNHHAEQTTLL